jgi:protein-S-isoprenylcysteine O-methyltransferase Ste14
VQVRYSGGRFTPDCQAIDRPGRAPFVVRLVGFFALVGVLIAYALDPAWIRALDWPIPDAARWVGFAFGLAGLASAGWAQVTLGCQWSVQLQLTEGHKLITQGPHSWIRHPICAAPVSLSIG